MNTSKIFFVMLLSIFLIAVASAVPVSYGEWQGGNNSISINNGTSAGFNFYFDSTLSSMYASIKLYDSSGNYLYTFLDSSIPESYYYNYNPWMITPQIYKNPGSYTLTFYSKDASNAQSAFTIYLTVNSVSNQTTNDTIPPIVTLNSPINNNVSAFSLITFNGTASDNVGIKNVTLYLNGIANSTNSSGLNNTNYLFTLNLSNGTYFWNYLACDTSGNCAFSTANILTINVQQNSSQPDTTPPQIQFISPTPVNNAQLSQSDFPVEVSASDSGSGLSVIYLYVYNSASSLIENITISSLQSVDIGSLSSGTYYTYAIAFDNAGNFNRTETRAIIILAGNNNQNNLVSTNYHYVDVYDNQYLQQINRTNSGINLGEQTTQSSNKGWILLLILSAFVLVIILVLIFLLNRLRN